jgi:hypothetical protein
MVVAGKSRYATAGSGVLISDSPHFGCLLTARHMFYDPESGWMPMQVNLRLPPETGNDPVTEGFPVKLVDNGKNLWTSPSDGSDIAVIPLPSMPINHLIRSLAPASFGNDQDIYQGAQILVLGYPSILGEDFLTTPYARGGIISWVDIGDPLNKPFLVDSNLFPGNSGGPVFHVRNGFNKEGGLTLGGGVSLIGIVSKGAKEMASVIAGGVPINATNPATGQVAPAQAMVLGIGGIGLIEPISRARSIIDACLHSSNNLSTIPTQTPAPQQ